LDYKLNPLDASVQDILIYGTYSKSGKLRKDEILLIEALSKRNYILVVQNGSLLDPLLNTLNCSYILRKNLGRDFGMLRDAFGLIDIVSSEHNLIWLNSSCVWDNVSLQELINREKSNHSADIVSMTDSWRGGYHLQSFFYFIHSNGLMSFRDFFEKGNVRNWRSKRTIVFLGEKKISKYLIRSGLMLGSFYPARNYSKSQYKLVTTYIDFKDQLFREGAPFTKL